MKRAILREAVILAWECRCQWCARNGNRYHDPDGKPWHVDRIVPGSAGGRYEVDNVVLACAYCNVARSNRSPQWIWSYLARIPPLPRRTEGLLHISQILSRVFL
jgi:hypothetical protein